MKQPHDAQSDYERGFAAGFESGRRSRFGLGKLVIILVALYLAALLFVNLLSKPVQDRIVPSVENLTPPAR